MQKKASLPPLCPSSYFLPYSEIGSDWYLFLISSDFWCTHMQIYMLFIFTYINNGSRLYILLCTLFCFFWNWALFLKIFQISHWELIFYTFLYNYIRFLCIDIFNSFSLMNIWVISYLFLSGLHRWPMCPWQVTSGIHSWNWNFWYQYAYQIV